MLSSFIGYYVECYDDRQIYLLLYSANLTHDDPIYSMTANKKKTKNLDRRLWTRYLCTAKEVLEGNGFKVDTFIEWRWKISKATSIIY